MKISTKRKRKGGIWFAWHPVISNDNNFVWLEKVKRTPIYAYNDFMYYSYDEITQSELDQPNK